MTGRLEFKGRISTGRYIQLMETPAIPQELAPARPRLPLAPFAAICACIAYAWILSAGFYNSSMGRFPLAAVGAAAALLTILDTRMGLGLLIFAIGISPEYQLEGITNLRLEDFLFPIVLLSWLARFVVRNDRFVPTDLKLPIILTLFVSMISSFINSFYSQADLSVCLFRLAKSLEYFLIFAVTLNTLRKEADIRRFVYLMVAVGALVGIYGMFQTFQAHIRVTGPLGETANILGGYYVFHICLAIGLLATPQKYRLMILIALGIMVLSLLNTFARTSYVALFGGIAAMFLVRRNAWIGLIAIICTLSVLLSTEVSERVLTILRIFQGEIPSSLESRVVGWMLMLGYFADAPILGHGIGTLSLGAFDNESVRQMFELGLLGLSLFVWMMGLVLRTGFHLSRSSEDPTFRGFAYGCFGGTVALLVHSFGATTFTTIRTAESFFFAMGVLYAIAAKAPSRQDLPELYEELPAELPAV